MPHKFTPALYNSNLYGNNYTSTANKIAGLIRDRLRNGEILGNDNFYLISGGKEYVWIFLMY